MDISFKQVQGNAKSTSSRHDYMMSSPCQKRINTHGVTHHVSDNKIKRKCHRHHLQNYDIHTPNPPRIHGKKKVVKSTAIQFLNRSYPIDDTVWHHPNDMADTSWHDVHPWSWRNNTKQCNMTESSHSSEETKSIYQRQKRRQPHHAHRWIQKRQTDNQ